MPKYSPHPFAKIFVPHSDALIGEMAADMKENGQDEDIVLLDGMILDGSGRYMSGIMAGMEEVLRFRQFGTRQSDGADPLKFVKRKNLLRRHSSAPERALAAVEWCNLERGHNQYTNRQHRANGETANSQKAAAKNFQTTVNDIGKSKRVRDKAVPELLEAMRKGDIAISDAAAIAEEPPDVQRKAVEAVLDKRARTAKGAVAAAKGPAPEVFRVAGRELEQFAKRVGKTPAIEETERDAICAGLAAAAARISALRVPA